MDGFQKRLKASIQPHLSFSLSIAIVIVIVAVMAGIFSFVSAFDAAHAQQDDMLQQIAALFDRQHLPLPHPNDAGRAKGSSEESRVIVQYLTADSNMNKGDRTGKPLAPPQPLPDGLHSIELDDEAYRVLVRSTSSGHELRSSGTALSLQAKRLVDAAMPAPARGRLVTLQRGIERGRILLDQLLTLAKVQAATRRPLSRVTFLIPMAQSADGVATIDNF